MMSVPDVTSARGQPAVLPEGGKGFAQTAADVFEQLDHSLDPEDFIAALF